MNMLKSKLRKSGGGIFRAPHTSQGSSSSSKNIGVAAHKPEDVEQLRSKEKELDEKIKELKEKGYKTEEVQDYIQLLHDYNDVKDAAQIFMGQIANYECVPNREIAQRYNAPKSD